MIHYHDHTKVYEEPTPDVDRIDVLRVMFRRGAGCCEESPVRIVTSYFDIDGVLIAEMDPAALPLKENEVRS